MTTPFRSARRGDRLIPFLDQMLRALPGGPNEGRRGTRPTPRPAPDAPGEPLTTAEARHAAGLMRVNHAGEVAAQALYQGQALVARDPAVREHLLAAAREEVDHLDWCAERLAALGSRPSLLNPLWYAGSATIGVLAGLADDRISLGFVAETERQVEGHIDDHLEKLPPGDTQSRAILAQMKIDEVKHGREALDHGGAPLPRPIPELMRATARVMTRSAYYL